MLTLPSINLSLFHTVSHNISSPHSQTYKQTHTHNCARVHTHKRTCAHAQTFMPLLLTARYDTAQWVTCLISLCCQNHTMKVFEFCKNSVHEVEVQRHHIGQALIDGVNAPIVWLDFFFFILNVQQRFPGQNCFK